MSGKDQDMIERVARVIYTHYPVSMGEARISARAVIEAMQEPTEEMRDAGWKAASDHSDSTYERMAEMSYRAMIAAALSTQGQ